MRGSIYEGMEDDEEELESNQNKTQTRGNFNMQSDEVQGTNRLMGHSQGIASMGMRSQQMTAQNI